MCIFTVPAHPAVTVPRIDGGCMFIRQSRGPSDVPVSRRMDFRDDVSHTALAC